MDALIAEGVQVEDERYRLLHFEPLYQGPEIAGECPYPAPEVRAAMRTYSRGDFPVAEDVQPRLLACPLSRTNPAGNCSTNISLLSARLPPTSSSSRPPLCGPEAAGIAAWRLVGAGKEVACL